MKSNKLFCAAFFLIFMFVVPNAMAAIWTQNATQNLNADQKPVGSCPQGKSITGLKVKEQSSYGVIDVMLECGYAMGPNSGQPKQLTGQWIINNPNGDREQLGSCPAVAGAYASEQWRYGVVDIGLVCGISPNISFQPFGMLGNPNGVEQPAIICPSDYVPISLEVHEQWGYGVINFRFKCEDKNIVY